MSIEKRQDALDEWDSLDMDELMEPEATIVKAARMWLNPNEVDVPIHEAAGRWADAAQLADEQAEDEGLWFQAVTAPEAYLQQELRRLHAALTGDTE